MLVQSLGKGRLATGDPESVPVGRYAQEALTSLGVWSEVSEHLIRADSVRSALAFVDRGEAPLGIVYETDALVDKAVRVIDVFPSDSHKNIVYPIALHTPRVARMPADSSPTYAVPPAILRSSTTASRRFTDWHGRVPGCRREWLRKNPRVDRPLWRDQ